MRTHYLQHVPYEKLGSVKTWLDAEKYQITSTRFFESTILPDPKDLDLLIILGGPMSVNDESIYPWLTEEKEFIRDCIEKKKLVLGICLGAQLIAYSMGARVYPNLEKEIGWFPIEGLNLEEGKTFCFPTIQKVFHWHGETFDIPQGAYHLARSEACANQAFQIGRSVMGLQFHLESTPETVQEIVSHSRAEIIPSKFVQSESSIIADTFNNYREVNELMIEVLSYLRSSGI